MKSATSVGRPEAATAGLDTKISMELHGALVRAAESQGITFDGFIITALQDAVQSPSHAPEVMRFSLADQALIAQSLLNPLPLAPALVRALERRHLTLSLMD